MKRITALILAAAMVMSLGGCIDKETAGALAVADMAAETTTAAETVEPFTKEAGTRMAESKAAETKPAETKPAETAAAAAAGTAETKAAETKAAETKAAETAKAPAANETIATEKPVMLHPVIKDSYQTVQYPDNRVAYTLHWGKITLRDSETGAYQGLVKGLSDLGDKVKESVLADVDRFMETIKEAEKDGRKLQELTNDTKVIAVRSDSNFFSARAETYADFGGAHPSTVIKTCNFESKTGKQLVMSDIVADGNKLGALVKENLLKDYKKEEFFDLDKDLAKYSFEAAVSKDDDSQRAYTWLLGYDGIEIIFNQYEIAPYAAGIMTVKLGFKDHPELFKKGIELVPDSYAVQTDDSRDDANHCVVTRNVKTKAGDFVWKTKYMDDDESRIFIYPTGSNTSVKDIPGGDCQTAEQTEAEKAQEGFNCSQMLHTTEQIVDPYDFTTTAFERPAGKNITRHYTLDAQGLPVEK